MMRRKTNSRNKPSDSTTLRLR